MTGARAIAFWLAITAALVVSFGLDLANTAAGGAIDLRNRVTGVRLLERGVDPYSYKWTRDQPPEFCDVYNNPQLPVSKTTATPALLLLHAPLAALPYRLGEFAWLGAQWLLLLGLGALWLRATAGPWKQQALALLVTGFSYTAAWRLHAERGQVYVLLAAVFAAWLVATLHAKWSRHWTVGLIAGLLIALRPPFLLLVPFLALHRRAQLIGAVVGLAIATAAPMLLHPACWGDYFAAMQVNSELYRNGIDPRPGAQHYPAEIEGMPTRLMGTFAVIPYADASVFVLSGGSGWSAWPFLAGVVVAVGAWMWVTRKRPAEALLGGLAAWIFLTDFFLPAYRDNYNDVLALDVIAAAVLAAARVPWSLWIAAAAVPIGLLVYIFAPEQTALINLPTALLMAAALAALVENFRSPSRPIGKPPKSGS